MPPLEINSKRPTKSGQKNLNDGGFDADLIKRYIREFVTPRWREIAWAMLLTAGLAAVTGGYPLIIKYSFDTILSGKEGSIHIIIFAVIAVTLARSLLMYFQSIASGRLGLNISLTMKKRAFEKLMAADFARQTELPAGQRVSRLTNDVGGIVGATQAVFSTAARDTLSIIVLIGTMFYLDPVMAGIVLCVYPISAWPISAISTRLRVIARNTQEQVGDMLSLLTELLASSRLIKAFRLEDYAVGRLGHSFELLYALNYKGLKTRSRLNPALEALGGLAVAGVIGLAYWRISSGNATVGDFMGFVSALLLAAQPIRAVGNLVATLNSGIASAERVYQIIDDQPKLVDAPNAKALRIERARIEFDNVSFAYGAEDTFAAVRQLSLIVDGGSTVALVGRSGAGKSTLVNLIPRLFDVTSGQIAIDRQDIRNVTVSSLRDSIAIVSQDVTLFDDTIAANIALGRPDASLADIQNAAQAAAAHDFIMEKPNGYHSTAGESGSLLSGGQRQRLALARAILKDAPILLLDEATSALDTHSEAHVQRALSEFSKDRTTVVIAHRLSTVQNADMICVMDEGRIIEQGTHAELMDRGGAYADLCKTQLLAGHDGPEPEQGPLSQSGAPQSENEPETQDNPASGRSNTVTGSMAS
ncbi:MAG: ABC transporter ATP-binding protein [Hyphomicrobiaceae bacterium]